MNSNHKAPHPEPSGEASKKREDVLNRIAATIGLANALSGGKAHLTVDDLAVLDAGDGEAVAWQYRWKCDPTGFVYSTLVHPLEGNAPTPDEIEWWVYGVKPTAPPAREGVPEENKKVEPSPKRGYCENHKRVGGCPLHNLHCGWPKCDEWPAAASTAGEGAKQQ